MGDLRIIRATAERYVEAATLRAPSNGGRVILTPQETDHLRALVGRRLDPDEARALRAARVTPDMINTNSTIDMLSDEDRRPAALLHGRKSLQAELARGGVGFWRHVDQVGGAVAPQRMRDGALAGATVAFLGPEVWPAVPFTILGGAAYGWFTALGEGIWSAMDD